MLKWPVKHEFSSVFYSYRFSRAFCALSNSLLYWEGVPFCENDSNRNAVNEQPNQERPCTPLNKSPSR